MLPSAPKWGRAIGWTPRDDAMLLLGIYWHGMAHWEHVAADARLGLSAKLAGAVGGGAGGGKKGGGTPPLGTPPPPARVGGEGGGTGEAGPSGGCDAAAGAGGGVGGGMAGLPKASHLETRVLALLRKMHAVHTAGKGKKARAPVGRQMSITQAFGQRSSAGGSGVGKQRPPVRLAAAAGGSGALEAAGAAASAAAASAAASGTTTGAASELPPLPPGSHHATPAASGGAPVKRKGAAGGGGGDGSISGEHAAAGASKRSRLSPDPSRPSSGGGGTGSAKHPGKQPVGKRTPPPAQPPALTKPECQDLLLPVVDDIRKLKTLQVCGRSGGRVGRHVRCMRVCAHMGVLAVLFHALVYASPHDHQWNLRSRNHTHAQSSTKLGEVMERTHKHLYLLHIIPPPLPAPVNALDTRTHPFQIYHRPSPAWSRRR